MSAHGGLRVWLRTQVQRAVREYVTALLQDAEVALEKSGLGRENWQTRSLRRSACVFCGKAWAVDDRHGGVDWIVSYATPTGCDHETLEGGT